MDKNIKSFTTLRDHLIKLSEKHPETDSSIGPMIEKINSSIEKQEELRDDLTDTAASMRKSTTSLISDKKALDALVKENQKRLQQISKEYVAVNSTSQNTGWKFYLYKTKKSVEKSVYQMLFAEIPLIAGCVLIIFILGMAFSRLFTRKIEMLTENMLSLIHI